MKCECATMDYLNEDGFVTCRDWPNSSTEHCDKDLRDSSGFGDWTSFKEGPSEERAFTSQEVQTSCNEQVERGDEPGSVIHNCFHVNEMVRDTDMNVFPLSHLLHKSTPFSPSAVLLSKGASFYQSLLCEPKPPNITGSTPNIHSHKQLIDTLKLKKANTLQNPILPQLGFEKPESSSAALIQTKLTAPVWCQNSPGFFYQISHQWLSQYSL